MCVITIIIDLRTQLCMHRALQRGVCFGECLAGEGFEGSVGRGGKGVRGAGYHLCDWKGDSTMANWVALVLLLLLLLL